MVRAKKKEKQVTMDATHPGKDDHDSGGQPEEGRTRG
jgi:hypothetical protein